MNEVLDQASIIVRETAIAKIERYRTKAETCGCDKCVDQFNLMLGFSMQGMDRESYEMYKMEPTRDICIYRAQKE